MVDIIAGDGDITDILAAPGDRVFVEEGIEFLARILAPVGPVEVNIDGTVRPVEGSPPFPEPALYAVLLEGAESSLTIGETGLIDAEHSVKISGENFQFENAGTIVSSETDWRTSGDSVGVFVSSLTGSFLNTGTIGQGTTDLRGGVSFSNLEGGSAADLTAENSGKISGFFAGVSMSMDDLTFTNSGRIAGEIFGVFMFGENNTLINTGIIREVDTIDEEDIGPTPDISIRFVGNGNTFQNEGKTLGGLWIEVVDDVTVENSGVIRSDTVAIDVESNRFGTGNGVDIVTGFELYNTGTLRIVEDEQNPGWRVRGFVVR